MAQTVSFPVVCVYQHTQVYAIDLLGFGASSKPTTIQYSMELWRDLLLDFIAEFTSGVEGGVTMVGNSIGALACLMVSVFVTNLLTKEVLRCKNCHKVKSSVKLLAFAQVSADAPEGTVRGCVLLNSAGAMNNKGVISDWRIVAVYPLLLFIDFILSIPAFAQVR